MYLLTIFLLSGQSPDGRGRCQRDAPVPRRRELRRRSNRQRRSLLHRRQSRYRQLCSSNYSGNILGFFENVLQTSFKRRNKRLNKHWS